MAVRRFRLRDEFVEQYKDRPVQWGFMDEAGNSLGEVTFLRSYSRLKEDGSKEQWFETCRRVIEGMFTIQREHCFRNRFEWNTEKAQRTAQDAYDRMFQFKWMPPGRGLATMGADFILDEWDGTPLLNCSFVSTKSNLPGAAHFLMLASMNGVGVGTDVRGAGRYKVKGPEGSVDVVIPDTREGWADALRKMVAAHIEGKPKPVFDYSLIRPAGAVIKRFGGTASGPEVLKDLLDWIDDMMTKRCGNTLTVTDIADLMNKIGDCVISGSSRRSAEILLGADTDEFLDLKNAKINPVRNAFKTGWGYMSNNSILAEVGQDYIKAASRTMENGEPGYIWLDVARKYGRLKDGIAEMLDDVVGVNPCGEIMLADYEVCNLVCTSPNRHDDVEDYLKTLKVAYLYGKTVTLLPTAFPETNAIIAQNRRIGLAQSGITTYIENHGVAAWSDLCEAGYQEIKRLDDVYSRWLGVRPSIRMTTVKPDGSTGLVSGDSPGVHFNPASGYYIRRVTMMPSTLLDELRRAGYPVEESVYTAGQYVVSFPVKSPFKRSESEVSIWEKVLYAMRAQEVWSDNSVSVTVSYDPDTEARYIPLILSMFEGKIKSISFLPMGAKFKAVPYDELDADSYSAFMDEYVLIDRDAPRLSDRVLGNLSEERPIQKVLPKKQYLEMVERRSAIRGGVYAQMPYEEISEERYNEMCEDLFPILRENVYANGEEAIVEKFCSTDACEVSEFKMAQEDAD